jgi:hypothetical protein
VSIKIVCFVVNCHTEAHVWACKRLCNCFASLLYSLCCVFNSQRGQQLSHLCVLPNCIDLFQLESHQQEILDELYVVYCCLLSAENTVSGTHYRHFVIDHRSTITIKESSKLISQGTTGLCSWQVLRNNLKLYIFISLFTAMFRTENCLIRGQTFCISQIVFIGINMNWYGKAVDNSHRNYIWLLDHVAANSAQLCLCKAVILLWDYA